MEYHEQKKLQKSLYGIVAVLFCFLSIGFLSAATITTTNVDGDRVDEFSPGEIVYIRGGGFEPNGIVNIEVTKPNYEVDVGQILSDSRGQFVYLYPLDEVIYGNYYVYAAGGSVVAQTMFVDPAIWTRNACDGSTQNDNHFDVGETIHIHGEGFNAGNFNWEISGRPGGASCDPNQIVASGNHDVNNSGDFCFSAYLIPADDCGEYTVIFSNRRDNYQVNSNSICSENGACGSPSSELVCQSFDIYNETVTPTCSGGDCLDVETEEFVETCVGGSEVLCIGNNVTNITQVPSCFSGNCLNNTLVDVIEECSNGCFAGECLLPQGGSCGDGVIDFGEECDLGNLNGVDCGPGYNETCNYCSGSCTNITSTGSFCGDGIHDAQYELCDDGVNNGLPCVPGYNETCNYCDSICSDPPVIGPFCGDGIIQQAYEQCDDNNTINFDGCSSTCVIEAQCPDEDNDGICDSADFCPDSEPNEPVDQAGCDIFQFCDQASCGLDCFELDFMDDESDDPRDCMVVLIHRGGEVQEPRCMPVDPQSCNV